MPIDWSKPLRHAATKDPAKLVYTLDSSCTYRRVVVVSGKEGEWTSTYHDNTENLENVPERREWWANLFRTSTGGVATSDAYDSKEQANSHRSRFIDYIGEPVLLHVDNDNPPATDPEPRRWVNLYRDPKTGNIYTPDGRYASRCEALQHAHANGCLGPFELP